MFLPPYCPFYNPIEVVFAMVKQRSVKSYNEGSVHDKDLPSVVASVVGTLEDHSFLGLFRKCGYTNRFDPSKSFPDIKGGVDVKEYGFSESSNDLDPAPTMTES